VAANNSAFSFSDYYQFLIKLMNNMQTTMRHEVPNKDAAPLKSLEMALTPKFSQ
jgi:hypothetical protein